MSLIQTNELKGIALDWAVAKAANIPLEIRGTSLYYSPEWEWQGKQALFCPTVSWEQAGPLIESIAGLEYKTWLESTPATKCEAHIHNQAGDWIMFGHTPLVALMRVYVASQLGLEVDIIPQLLED